MTRAFNAIFAAILVLSFTAPVVAGPFEDGEAAERRGDNAAAVRAYQEAADQGHAEAQTVLGQMYYAAIGVHQDYVAAATLFRKAADQGHADAQVWLGIMYYQGTGVLADYVAAASWFQRAANQGDQHAQRNIGNMYKSGEGVPKDNVRAYMWLNLSAAQGHSGALEDRNALAQHMTPAQIAEAQKLAREWKPIKQSGR